MKALTVLASVLIAMALWLLGYTLAPLGYDDVYFIADAAAKTLLLFAFYRFVDKSLLLLKSVLLVLTFASLSNLFDEVFFDPCSLQVNEYVFILIVMLITFRYAKLSNRLDR